MKKIIIAFSFIFVFVAVTLPFKAKAATDTKIMWSVSSEDFVKLYVRGASASEEAVYQIGNVSAGTPASFVIGEDENPMRTLVLLDNSISIPAESREKIKAVIKAIIDGHGEGEVFRIATFAEEINYLSDRYSDDYTALINTIDSITHNDQDSRLTDVIENILTDWNEEGYQGYSRLIVISDGVNDNQIGGVTLARLEEELKTSAYPIYAIGSNTGSNGDLLDNLFMLSWLTNAEYIVLEENDVKTVASLTARDNDLVVFQSTIPEGVKTGGRYSSKLTLSDGTELVADVEMPFGVQTEVETETGSNLPEISVHSEPDTVFEIAKESVDETEPQKPFPLWLVFVLSAVGAALVVLLIVIIRRNKVRNVQPVIQDDSDYTDYQPQDQDISGEVPIHKVPRDGTVLLTPEALGVKERRYRITLTDCADSARVFSCELVDEVRVGRKPDNQISISDDTTVHGYHCLLTVRAGSFYITDLKTVKNHTSLNGVAIKPGMSQLIVSNSRVTIGRHTYVVNIGEG